MDEAAAAIKAWKPPKEDKNAKCPINRVEPAMGKIFEYATNLDSVVKSVLTAFDNVINDISRNKGVAFNIVDQNYENAIISIEDSRLAYNRQFENQILSLPLASKPNFALYALNAAANSSAMFMSTSAPSTPPAGSGTGINGGYYTDYQGG